MGNINWFAVIVAALASFIIGWLWYCPLFGGKWMEINGFTKENIKEGGLSMPVILIVNHVATVLAALALAMFIGTEANAGFGIFAGVMIAVFWIGTSRLNDVLYEKSRWDYSGLMLATILLFMQSWEQYWVYGISRIKFMN